MIIILSTVDDERTSKPISRVWYYECENESNVEITSSNDLEGTDEHSYQQGRKTWNLTTNERESKGKIGVRTANLQDVWDLGCVGGDVGLRDMVIHIDDGFFIWDGQVGEYEQVDDLKNVVLSRMEDKDIHINNESFYEEVLGWKNWKIHSWFDLNDYQEILG